MPDIKEHIAYLSQEIGARPAGTEEEQQAALYITEQFQKEAGLPANIEDFDGVGDPHLPSMICCGAAVVLALLSLIVPVLSIIGVIGCLAAAGLFAAEYLDKPIISKLLGKGVSQNVVAKYAPAASEDGEGARRRKVILVARYDTGKVRAELAGPTAQVMPLVGKISFGAMVALPVLLLIKGVALGSSEGALTTIFTLLTVIAMLLTAIPLALGALHQTAAYNEGANCNASGVAALLELARRIGAGRVSEAEIAEREDALMHGPTAAYESGLVPEGAEFVYSSHPRSSMENEESLIAAKAAISSPLLETSIAGAHGVIINITSSPDIGLEDVETAAGLITQSAHPDANIIWGTAFDENLSDEMRVTVVATGFDNKAADGLRSSLNNAAGAGASTPSAVFSSDVSGAGAAKQQSAAAANSAAKPVEEESSDNRYYDELLAILNKRK